jgi:hypothetical protein
MRCSSNVPAKPAGADVVESGIPPARPPRARVQWDRVTAIMATIVAACALGVSIYTARLQNAQIRAQTWPFLQLWQSNVKHTFSLSNRGVGPAQVRDVKLFLDGTEIDGFSTAFRRLAGRDPQPGCMLQSYFARRVLAANEDVEMLGFCNADDFKVIDDAASRLIKQICYCSLLEDCWRIDEAATSETDYRVQVDHCPMGKPGIFR